MSKAKDDQTPTETVSKDVGTGYEIDKKGRRIVVKALSALDYYRVSRALGAASATNEATLDLAMIACAVRKIDTLDIAMPANERDVEFLIQKLDFDGIAAAGIALAKLRGEEMAKAEIETSKN